MSGCHNALIAALVGSKMYGLSIAQSDDDYALFGIQRPENTAQYALQTRCNLRPEKARIDGVYRHICRILWMAEYSCIYHLAYLFSDDVSLAPEAEAFWRELRTMREDIAAVNLRRFRELCFVRMNVTKNRALQRPYDANNKAMMHTLFYCNLLKTFASGAPYSECIRQDTEILLAVRTGRLPEAEALARLETSLQELNTTQVVKFYRQPRNLKTMQKLQALIADYFGGNGKAEW